MTYRDESTRKKKQGNESDNFHGDSLLLGFLCNFMHGIVYDFHSLC
jgi:hypothetical protein